MEPLAQSGVTVRASLASGGGSLIGSTSGVTDAAGRVAFVDLGIAGSPGTYTVRFDADGFTGVVSPSIVLSLANTTTSIVSDAPDPSEVGQSVSVQFQVTSSAGHPTGTVSVSSSGGESCSASVAQGSCGITFSSDGQRTLTASYSGDASVRAEHRYRVAHRSARPTRRRTATPTPSRRTEDQDLVVNPRGVLNNDTDPNGGAIQALAGDPPAHGQLSSRPMEVSAMCRPPTSRATTASLSRQRWRALLRRGRRPSELEPVNDAPDFTPGPGPERRGQLGPADGRRMGHQIRPDRPTRAGQQVSFEVSALLGNSVFSTAPAVSPDGTLTYTPSGIPGTALVTVVAHDTAVAPRAGNDTSSCKNFHHPRDAL